jgi:hypothetical protein
MAGSVRAGIDMTEAEAAEFIGQQRSAAAVTVEPGGFPDLVAMWYPIIDGQVWADQGQVAGPGSAASGSAYAPTSRECVPGTTGTLGTPKAGPGG